MNGNQILLYVETLSEQRDLTRDEVFQAVELALAASEKRFYEGEPNIRVAVDRDTGEYQTHRWWTVVADEALGSLEFPEQALSLSKAQKLDPELIEGSIVEQPLQNHELERRDAQQALQLIKQLLGQYRREKIGQRYREKIGQLFSGVVSRVTREAVHILLEAGVDAVLMRDQLIPREIYRVNDRVKAVLIDVRDAGRGAQLVLSRLHPELLVGLMRQEVPEVEEQVITVRAVARDPGVRSKVAVKTNDGRIDPRGACVGVRGARVQAVSNEIAGERIDIIVWDDNPAQLVINALAPAEVQSIVVDEVNHSMDIAVKEDQLSIAIGRSGQNIRLASELTGWKLNVMSEEQADEKHDQEQVQVIELLTTALDVDEDLAQLLLEEGFRDVEEVAEVSPDVMVAIEGFDEEIVTELQQRAKAYLVLRGMVSEHADDMGLSALPGMTRGLMQILGDQGIATRDDLAECSVDELTAMIDVSQEEAAKMIMAAREHWFVDSQSQTES